MGISQLYGYHGLTCLMLGGGGESPLLGAFLLPALRIEAGTKLTVTITMPLPVLAHPSLPGPMRPTAPPCASPPPAEGQAVDRLLRLASWLAPAPVPGCLVAALLGCSVRALSTPPVWRYLLVQGIVGSPQEEACACYTFPESLAGEGERAWPHELEEVIAAVVKAYKQARRSDWAPLHAHLDHVGRRAIAAHHPAPALRAVRDQVHHYACTHGPAGAPPPACIAPL